MECGLAFDVLAGARFQRAALSTTEWTGAGKDWGHAALLLLVHLLYVHGQLPFSPFGQCVGPVWICAIR